MPSIVNIDHTLLEYVEEMYHYLFANKLFNGRFDFFGGGGGLQNVYWVNKVIKKYFFLIRHNVHLLRRLHVLGYKMFMEQRNPVI